MLNMSDRNKKRGGANKGVSEVEMIGTGDSKLFHRNQPGAGDVGEEGFAQPKGVQTRAAIANHLAKKLKIEEDASPDVVFQQYQQMIADEKDDQPEFDEWERKIKDARNII